MTTKNWLETWCLFISSTKTGCALAFPIKFASFFFFYFLLNPIDCQVMVEAEEVVLDAIYPCVYHEGHSRVNASRIDQKMAVRFLFSATLLLLSINKKINKQKEKNKLAPFINGWITSSYWFDLFCFWSCRANGFTAHEIESSKIFSKYIEFRHRSLLSIHLEWWIP